MVSNTAIVPEVFWTTPLDFKSDYGAEDPLALDYISQQIGNWLLPGITTRTSRAFYYPMVLYGLCLAEKAITEYELVRRDGTVQQLFERWERFWAIAIARHYRGSIPPEHSAGMRGVRGAQREAVANSGQSLPTDYKLITRQLELAALGAYLSSLRHYELVQDGTLTPTKLGRDIAAEFWADGGHRFDRTLEGYALMALDPKRKKYPSKHAVFTIEKLGTMCRLGQVRRREVLKMKLWDTLFTMPSRRVRQDPTPEVVTMVLSANKAEVVKPKDIIYWSLSAKGKKAPSGDLRDLLDLARTFEEFASWTRITFDRLFKSVSARGCTAPIQSTVRDLLPKKECKNAARLASDLLGTQLATKIAGLPFHGGRFMEFVEHASSANASAMFESMLSFHRSVQVFRRRSDGWVRILDGDTISCSGGYSAVYADRTGWTHGFKLDALRMLLADLGRIDEG